MGLDWMPVSKTDGGHTVSKFETAGCPRLSRDAPDTVEHFRRIVEGHQQQARFHGVHSAYARHWLRPFDTLLDEAIADGTYLPDLAPASDGRGRVVGILADPFSFRGKVVGSMVGLPAHLQERAYHDLQPEDALDYADALERCAGLVGPDNRPDLEGAVRFLRYWGRNGHGIHAWY